MLCTLESNLSATQLAEIKKFETETGISLLAFRCFKSNPAKLNEAKLKQLKQMEKELGICLVAVQGKLI